ncbi:aminotransferase class 3 [Drepanopeziza brunnea f. sp. 'multigermtubi' MB_m1]|uniref:Aminotransferase class 3 n=2 Tax=Drepanopeziza brunnea f. sp. 'multigermtubi' TaxID=698441 RepID=K1XJX4_MARBU|nr:aminotransferase class 3 [Drepanopeziza brunnea f. sp. 'multigermtubi' MB_m1]EKD12709.1 aminotransferase class 3 [Drepanopeziza brunnea f. sp. 'multigermtubi' MB_m1]
MSHVAWVEPCLFRTTITKRFSPSGVELVRFTNSGTEASTMAVAAALAFTNRKKILVFTSGYHGGTMSFPSPLNSINANLPHEFVLAPYNDVEGTKRVLSSLPKDSLAAIVVEGVHGSGGCIVGNPFFLHFLNATARELGAVLIMDEVMTSRLAYHGLSAKLALKPDLITLGKWVGGGMTFGAFGGRKDIMSMFDPRTGVLGHSGTFNNNVITMAAGCCGLDIYDEHEVERLNAMGEDLLQRIQIVLVEAGVRAFKADSKADPISSQRSELECPFSGILPAGFGSEKTAESLRRRQKNSMGVTGQGSMLHIHFYGPSTITLKALFWHHMLDCGIYIAQRGFMALNLELTNRNVDEFEEAVRAFLIRYGDALR